jgi:hypothetical protein
MGMLFGHRMIHADVLFGGRRERPLPEGHYYRKLASIKLICRDFLCVTRTRRTERTLNRGSLQSEDPDLNRAAKDRAIPTIAATESHSLPPRAESRGRSGEIAVSMAAGDPQASRLAQRTHETTSDSSESRSLVTDQFVVAPTPDACEVVAQILVPLVVRALLPGMQAVRMPADTGCDRAADALGLRCAH